MEQVYAIVSQLGAELGDPLGPAQPLGGPAGRNYRVRLTTGEYVVRLPRRETPLLGPSREAERLANEMAASLGFAPPVVGAGPDWLVTEFIDRRPIDPESLRADPGPVAVALRSFHQSGLALPVRLWVPELLERCAALIREHGAELPGAYAPAQALVARIGEALPLADPVPCHNNLLEVNVLALAAGALPGPTRIALVDWEYAAMGHHLFDLASLAVQNDFSEQAEDRLLAAYFGEEPKDDRRCALRLMRVVVHAREAAEAVARGAFSGSSLALEALASEHFGQLQRAAEDPRLDDWLSSASG